MLVIEICFQTIWTGEEYGFDPVQFEEDDDNDDEFSGDGNELCLMTRFEVGVAR